MREGDYGFDPLGFSSGEGAIKEIMSQLPMDKLAKVPGVSNIGNLRALQEAEIKNGRAAMMAITGFSVAECVWGKPVTELTPWFF